MRTYIFILVFAIVSLGCSSDSNEGSSFNSADSIGQGGSLATFVIKGDYLYTVDNEDLNVFNITTTTDPVLVNTVPIGFDIETLFSYKDYLYIGSRNGMFIYNVNNPEFPVQLSSVQHFTSCDPVVANSNYAFVTLWSDLGCGGFVNQLEVYDVSDVLNPMLVNIRQLTFPKGLGLYGDYLIVCDDEIKIFDVTNPAESVLVHSIDRLVFDVIIQGDLLIAVGESGVFQYALNAQDITDTTALSTISI
ncbi:LVIVD repeat-containing protein [Dokdonia sp. Asnod3-C12]|uniref:LVIVD repeat-containing protein n=1 Tax=Dokdonia sp. Asnod3-C12 TaxID=3160575 RepID=UPI00386F6D54